MTIIQFIVSALMLSAFVAMSFEKIGAAVCLAGGGILIISYFG